MPKEKSEGISHLPFAVKNHHRPDDMGIAWMGVPHAPPDDQKHQPEGEHCVTAGLAGD